MDSTNSLNDILSFLESQVFGFWAQIINYFAHTLGINLSNLSNYGPWLIGGLIALLIVFMLFRRYLMWLFNIGCIVLLFEITRRLFFRLIYNALWLLARRREQRSHAFF